MVQFKRITPFGSKHHVWQEVVVEDEVPMPTPTVAESVVDGITEEVFDTMTAAEQKVLLEALNIKPARSKKGRLKQFMEL